MGGESSRGAQKIQFPDNFVDLLSIWCCCLRAELCLNQMTTMMMNEERVEVEELETKEG
jgi:hypothetical protein